MQFASNNSFNRHVPWQLWARRERGISGVHLWPQHRQHVRSDPLLALLLVLAELILHFGLQEDVIDLVSKIHNERYQAVCMMRPSGVPCLLTNGRLSLITG